MFISEHDLMLNLALLLFAGLTAIAFGYFVASTVTDRIANLKHAAEQLAQGDLETRLPVRGGDEIAELTKTFNWMANHLDKMSQERQRVEQARRDLIAWASHDLRTPLTSIRAMVEAMVDDMVTDEATAKRYLQNTLTEVRQLNRQLDDLFELAQLDTVTCQTRKTVGFIAYPN